MSIEIVKIKAFRITTSDFKVRSWSSNGDIVICIEQAGNNTLFLWKDGTVHHNSTGLAEIGGPAEMSLAAGYWKTEVEARIFLAGWRSLSPAGALMVIKHREKTVSPACAARAACLKVEPYVFQAGDVLENFLGAKRIVVKEKDNDLYLINSTGLVYKPIQWAYDRGFKKIGTLQGFIGE